MTVKQIIPSVSPWEYPFEDNAFLRGVIHSNPNKPFINFLHGNGFCGQTYWPFLKGLTTDYSVLIQDCVGHGDSDVGSGFQSWQQSAQHAFEILQYKLKRGIIQQPLLGMGHSFGGVLTIKLAAQYPELFERLVLLDPILMPEVMFQMKENTTIRNPLAEKTRTRQSVWDNRTQALAYLKTKSAYKTWCEGSLNAFLDFGMTHHGDGRVSLKCPPDVEADIYSSAPDGLWDDIRKLKVPTVILYGDQSYPFIEGSCQTAGENPVITIAKRAGGHCFMLEHPEETAKITKQYLSATLC